MNGLHCPRVDDAASYVLRAMPDGEWEHYEAHLASCTSCAEKVAELGFVADALLSGVPQLTAPAPIRDRVMSVVRAESELLRAAGPAADRPEPARSKRRWSLLSLRPLPALALASVALVLGVGGGALLTGGDGGGIAPRTVQAKVGAAGATANVRVSSDGAKLQVADMPAAPEGRIYQVWLKHRDRALPQPTDALFSVSSEGRASVDVPGDLDDVDAVLVTDEPAGGSRLPTRPPVITATLT
ncbi:MAG TPA: anti-sigma factor [Solirubrobacteraceae bacterium]|nr:anti-sigma factor [Solirubrobacteraceae bacterium]